MFERTKQRPKPGLVEMSGRIEKTKEVEKEESRVGFRVGSGMIESFCGWKTRPSDICLVSLMKLMTVDSTRESWMRMRSVMFAAEVKLL